MANNFRWENVQQFISLVNLLSLRNGGQLGLSSASKVDEEIHEADSDIGDYGSDNSAGGDLKHRFLDRFAEVMSRDKGGKSVSCVALRESGDRHIEEDVRVSLLVARNETFSDHDQKFFSTVEKLLSVIGASMLAKTGGTVKNALWEELLRYSAPRLDFYADTFKENLKSFKNSGFLNGIPPYKAAKLPLSSDTEARTFCDDTDIGAYSESTHDAYMRFAQDHIRELDDILHSGNRASQRRLLAEKAYSIRHMMSIRVLINSCSVSSLAQKLLSDILFLGRLMSCYFTLMAGAESIPGFCRLSIVLVKTPAPRISPPTLLPLGETMKCLGLSLNPTSVRKFIGTKSSVISAERSFKQLQSNISKRCLPTHAEVQLILHIAKTIDVETMNREIYPYIGCSKLSCFLCTSFLKSFGGDDTAFRTRGCHGKIYTLWSIPDIAGLRDDTVIALNSTMKKMRNILAREIIKPISSTPHVPESSAGVTDVYSPQTQYIDKYHRELNAQREFDSLSASAPWRRSGNKDCEELEELDAESAPEVAELPKAPAVSTDECAYCGCKTPRKCSKCGGPRLCSQSCEISWGDRGHNFHCALGRPLDSADHLLRDCEENVFPDDEDTLEDFGFTKFASVYDKQKLLGLYIGLTRIIGVASRELHQWQVEGTLVKNIISKFEAIPQHCRGGYYPWFRENLHVFNSDSSQDFLAAVRPYLEPEDRSKAPHELTPEAKAKSFVLYSLLLNGYHPNPSLSDKMGEDLYFQFGFVAGRGFEGERVLPILYRRLISKCSFKEFWHAHQSNSLISLMDANGLQSERKRVHHLEPFLKMKPNGWCPTVWHLRLFTYSSNAIPPRYITVDYGFSNCNTVEEKFALKNVYKDLLQSPQVDPMELHAACVKGKLYDFARQYDPNLKQRFRRLMRNPYPLEVDVEWAGMCANTVEIHGPPELAQQAISLLGPQSVRLVFAKK
ncbi:hypothetical protein J3A83DRAFT_3472439 [Scleroderma citrinum]